MITDKDFTKRTVFSEVFPNASLHICLFHTLRSFRREITCEKLGIRPGEQDHCLELISKLAYFVQKVSIMLLCWIQHLSQSSPITMLIGMASNTNGWIVLSQLVQLLGKEPECINSKVKSVCSKFVSLQRFLISFFAVLSVLQNERDHDTIMALVKKPVTHDLEQDQFVTMLTPYALQLVAKQLGLRKKVKILANQDDTYEVSSSEGCIYIIHTCTVIIIYMLGTLLVTCDSCHCSFASTMQLPYHHMFAVRDARQIPLYSEVGGGNRWKMA